MSFQWVLNLNEKLSDKYDLVNIKCNKNLLEKRKLFIDLIVGLKLVDAGSSVINAAELRFGKRPILNITSEEGEESISGKGSSGEYSPNDPFLINLTDNLLKLTEDLTDDETILIMNNIDFKNFRVVADTIQL